MEPRLREEIDQLHARLCHALSDPNRILLLYTVAEKPHFVTELCEALEIPQPTASRHLKVLRERGLVNASREGQSIRYSLADQRIIEALDILRAVLADHLRAQGAIGHSVMEELKL